MAHDDRPGSISVVPAGHPSHHTSTCVTGGVAPGAASVSWLIANHVLWAVLIALLHC